MIESDDWSEVLELLSGLCSPNVQLWSARNLKNGNDNIVERIVGKEEAQKITEIIIDLPIETLKDCINDYQRLLIKVLYI